MQKQLDEIWNYARSVASLEDLLHEPPTAKTVNPESIRETVDKLNEVLANNDQVDKKTKATLHYMTKNYLYAIRMYTHQEEILAQRNNYSKSDPDANYMRMKEDHMRN